LQSKTEEKMLVDLFTMCNTDRCNSRSVEYYRVLLCGAFG